LDRFALAILGLEAELRVKLPERVGSANIIELLTNKATSKKSLPKNTFG